jgi:hypothetical protein
MRRSFRYADKRHPRAGAVWKGKLDENSGRQIPEAVAEDRIKYPFGKRD